jgi:hypothetical protein
VTRTSSPAERTFAAETRAAALGHRAFVQDDGSIRVVSDSHPGKFYLVRVYALAEGEPVTFTCEPNGPGAFSDDHRVMTSRPGQTHCIHSAVAAKRLAREGLARRTGPLFGSAWVATEKAAELTARRLPPPPDDVFAGLPK